SIRIFMQLIADEITKGNHPFLVLSQAGYKSLARKFEKNTGKKHGLKQLNNKYMSLKKEWHTWRKLMDSSKGVSRIGFDIEIDKMESVSKILFPHICFVSYFL
ncbi:L10-interacting MYB domain-containing protein, partial [Camellia lanceoleosa]